MRVGSLLILRFPPKRIRRNPWRTSFSVAPKAHFHPEPGRSLRIPRDGEQRFHVIVNTSGRRVARRSRWRKNVHSKAQVSALCAGDGWLEKGANLLLFGPPGGGKSHLASAIGLALVEKGWRVLFARTSDLVQRLQVARREFGLEAALQRLDRYHLLILDDLVYVTKDQAETSVLFELISTRYERRSVLITANQPFGEWGKVFQELASDNHRRHDSDAA